MEAVRSLVWATDFDALPLDTRFRRRSGHLLVRSPSNPGHYWGNLLLLDDAPRAGDGRRWEGIFEESFADQPAIAHSTFAWDRTDGDLGAAREEFVGRGYQLAELVGLMAEPREIRVHPRENREVLVRELDPAPGRDGELWEQLLERQLAASTEGIPEAALREFRRARHRELRALFAARGGGWFLALDPGGQEILGSCGVIVNGERASIHDVDTFEPHRRRGICSRLLVEAAHTVAGRSSTRQVVIAADPGYHALELYESLGLRPRERVAGVWRRPSSPTSS